MVDSRSRVFWVRFGPVVAGLAMLAYPTARPSADQSTAAPPASEIVARHVKAAGGAAAWKRVSSIKVRGTLELPGQGLTGSLEMFAARPSSMLLRATIEGLGRIEKAYNGQHGWSIDPMAGPALMTGRELLDTKDDAWFDSQLYEPDFIKSMTTVGAEDFDNRRAYKVQFVLQSGREQTEYFDAETGLAIGSESRQETPMGVVPTVSVMRDYKPFGGIMQPTLLIQRLLGIEQVVRITSIEIDAVPPGTFDPSPEIKALIKAPRW